MNIVKLITSLQQAASAATTPAEYATLSKAIEKLNVGKVSTVPLISGLPTNLATNGNLYFVTSEADLYYNVGPAWKLLYTNTTNVLYGWGLNDNGRVGDDSIVSKLSPVTVVGGITNWSKIASGGGHSLALTSSGILYSWGGNSYGRLGDGTTDSRSSPGTVIGGITSWTQVSAGLNHCVALTSAGIAYAWGQNFYGNLGDGTTTERTSPVTVVGSITTWTQVIAAGRHNLGLTSAGVAYAWGQNGNGQLGDNSTATRSSPVTVVGGITTWSILNGSMTSGQGQGLGITSAGVAYAWGLGTTGQLGNNASTNRSSPVTVVGGITNWSFLTGGGQNCLGLTSTGVIYGWGGNTYGSLGDGTTAVRSSPVTVVGGITSWSQIGAGYRRGFGLTSTGILYAWGRNNYGGLGDNTTSNRSSPVTVVGALTNWSSVAPGSFHTIALTTAVA
jgi:alpha-tubulin suppressor-like RCC1 family protein